MTRAGVLLLLAACHGPTQRAAAPVVTKIPTYEVSLQDGGATIRAEATYPVGMATGLRADPPTAPFFHDVEVQVEGGWQAVAQDGDTWPACASTCRVRWSFALGDAARVLHDHDYAQQVGSIFLAPPGSFLLRPAQEHVGIPFRLHVAPSAVQFLTGVLPTGEASTYQADLADLADLPYTAIGRYRAATLPLADATLHLALVGPTPDVGDARVTAWVQNCAVTIQRYFGRFALRHAAIIVLFEDGDAIEGGMTMGNGGGSVLVHVGRHTTERALRDDWQMTHEMVHLSMPNMPEAQRWLEEGLATYVEPLARARRGLVGEAQVWKEMVRGMSFGLPLADEGGLDETHTWGRTYWGGALFALLADVRIREQTHGGKSLDDALRAVQAAGGNAATRWSMQRVIEVGDHATGTTVLQDLYRTMALAPLRVDLPALWAQLGIRREGGRITFGDHAPLAAIRAALTARTSN